MVRGKAVGKLQLGNLEAHRDWGHAEDYVRAMWLMMQQDVADDYVIATGKTHSVQEFLDMAFSLANLDPKEHVSIDANLFRPAEVEYLKGDATKAKTILGWNNNISFNKLILDMVESDISNA